MSSKFRKKPLVIEAFRYAQHPVPDWAQDKMTPLLENGADVVTPEGTMHANYGDWIIRGIKGEVYPCHDDIFRATYEREDGASVDGTPPQEQKPWANARGPDTARIRACAPLLPDPGPEVVRDLCDEIDRLRAQIVALQEALKVLL